MQSHRRKRLLAGTQRALAEFARRSPEGSKEVSKGSNASLADAIEGRHEQVGQSDGCNCAGARPTPLEVFQQPAANSQRPVGSGGTPLY